MKKNKGFSLIELILVLSIIMGLMVGIFYIYKNVKENLAAKSISDQMISLKSQYDSLAGSAGVAGQDKLELYLNNNCDIDIIGGVNNINFTDYNKKCFKDIGVNVDQSSSSNNGTFIGFAGGYPAVYGIKSASMCVKVVSDLYSILPESSNNSSAQISLFYGGEEYYVAKAPGQTINDELAQGCSYFNNADSNYYIGLIY